MPADPQEPLEETVESCLSQEGMRGWRTWDMSVCCACEEIWIAVQDRCMDLDKGLAQLWSARFCKLYFFDACVTQHVRRRRVLKAMGYEFALIRITDVFVLSLTFVLQCSLNFLILCHPQPPTSGGWSAGNERPDASRSTRACGRDRRGWSGIMDNVNPGTIYPYAV